MSCPTCGAAITDSPARCPSCQRPLVGQPRRAPEGSDSPSDTPERPMLTNGIFWSFIILTLLSALVLMVVI